MTEDTGRRHVRLKHAAKIQVVTPPGEMVTVCMRDFSESGLFLACKKDNVVEIDDIVNVKTLEIEDALVQKAKVVRIEEGMGFAVEFLEL